jgi:murein DD-endopeptidase MepM/ murein hydrolase activator NlpD
MIQPKRKKLREPYRLLLLRDDTLAEVGSYKLSILNIYIAVSAILLFTTALVFVLIFLTPIRRLVPGYANVYESREYRELNKQVRALENEMQDQRLYIARFRHLLSGIPDVVDTSTLIGPADNREEAAKNAATRAALLSQPPLTTPTFKPADNPGDLHGTSFLNMVPPLRGVISATFNRNAGHFGTDILAPENTPIVAILDGTVIAADWTLETGNTLAIQHSGNMVSFYKHNSRNLKPLGASVKAGEAVAIIGNTGENTTGPHLHFELWFDGKPLDPENFINF